LTANTESPGSAAEELWQEVTKRRIERSAKMQQTRAQNAKRQLFVAALVTTLLRRNAPVTIAAIQAAEKKHFPNATRRQLVRTWLLELGLRALSLGPHASWGKQ